MKSTRRPARDSNSPAPRKRPPAIRDRFRLLLDCRDEAEQRKLYEELAARGVPCRVWVI